MTEAHARLYLSQEPGLGRLTALEFGRVDDGQPGDCWDAVNEHVGLLFDEPGGRCVGFMVREFWLDCLQSGDSIAHYALGYELFELGRLPEAYRHRTATARSCCRGSARSTSPGGTSWSSA